MPGLNTFSFWAQAPNRHLEPVLEVAAAQGRLPRCYYSEERLSNERQLGTPPAVNSSGLTVVEGAHQSRERLVALVRGSSSAFHLIHGVGARLCREVMEVCAVEGAPYFVWAESLQPRSAGSPVRWVRDRKYRRLLRAVTGVFAMSPAAARDMARLGVARHRIYPAAYAGPIWPVSESRHDRMVIYCGRLIPIKALDTLARAVARLRQFGSPVDLHVVGDGPERSRVERITGSNAVFHGAVSTERVRELLSVAGVLVLPTRRREGWGYVVNEAFACGVPVVVSDVVGAREIVVQGRNGFTFPVGDEVRLAEAIRMALALRKNVEPLAQALATTRAGLEPTAVLNYMIACTEAAFRDSMEIPVPPWHAAVEALGGNDSIRWWTDWNGVNRAQNDRQRRLGVGAE